MVPLLRNSASMTAVNSRRREVLNEGLKISFQCSFRRFHRLAAGKL
jgi:hypothetical protein